MTGIDCLAVLKALSDLTRMRIIRLLLKEPSGVNEIARQLKVSQYNVSKHPRILREARLVEMEQHGKNHLYAITSNLKSQLAANRNVLELGCCFRFDKLPKWPPTLTKSILALGFDVCLNEHMNSPCGGTLRKSPVDGKRLGNFPYRL